MDYGAIIQKLEVANKVGKKINVVVGFDEPIAYLKDDVFLGASIGRYAGRISNGGFMLNEKKYSLYTEEGVHLHGGKEGFGKKLWTFEEVNNGTEPFARLSYLSKDMEEGYPGNLKATVTYTLIDKSFRIEHTATTDKTTVVNLTDHSYYNLDGDDSVSHYDLKLNCSTVLQTHDNLIPTGEVESVFGKPLDFTKEKKIGDILLDTPFLINENQNVAANVYSPKSGISMEVITNQPALVVYTPEKFGAICFETQNCPDAPNHQNFPSAILNPGEVYKNTSEFNFGIR